MSMAFVFSPWSPRALPGVVSHSSNVIATFSCVAYKTELLRASHTVKLFIDLGVLKSIHMPNPQVNLYE